MVAAGLDLLLVLTVAALAVVVVRLGMHREAPQPQGGTEAASSNTGPDGAKLGAATVAAILTQPDTGTAGATMRWDQPQVDVYVDLPAGHQALQPIIDQALAWDSAHSGIAFRRSDNPAADMTITAQQHPGGHVTVRGELGRGIITHADVTLGCCLERPVWEEIAQATGPTGDRAPGGSVFSNNYDVIQPSDFDALVVETLYQLPPGSPPGAVLSHLRPPAP